MKKILLTNIGNRNIQYKNSLYKPSPENPFRSWSKNLLENYPELKEDLDINIINPLVTSKDYNHIIIFYSDQENISNRIGQDTLYEAEIIKKILIDKYGYFDDQITLKKINVIVVKNGELLKFYRKSLRYYQKKFENPHFTICDAGGTPQQKMALKVISEYLFEPSQYNVKYAQNNELVTDVNVNEYRNVINNEIATRFISSGDYLVASELLDINHLEIAHLEKNHLKRFLAFVYFRFSGNQKLAEANARLLAKKEIEAEHYISNIQILPNISASVAKKILDQFHKAYFLFSKQKYSPSILAFSQFYEMLFEEHFKAHFDKDKYGKLNHQTEKQSENLNVYVKRNLTTFWNLLIEKNKEHARINITDLGTQCLLLQNSSNIYIKLANNIAPYIEYSYCSNKNTPITRYRNKIAHDGKVITQVEIDNELSYFPILLQNIARVLKIKNNKFEELNNRTNELIRFKL